VALVGTNPTAFESVGLSRSDLSGVVVLDTGPFNVERQLADTPPLRYGQMLRTVFGEDPSNWPAASPWHHVEAGAGIPPFLVFYHQGRGDAPRQSIPFVKHLQSAGVDARVVEATGKTHGSLNRDLGAEGDRPTEQVLEFLDRHRDRPSGPGAKAPLPAG
jgi:acetyl esterase/lipase